MQPVEEVDALADEAALLVDVPRSRAEGLVEHITKYIITDRVEPSLLPVRSLLPAGERAHEAWASAGGVTVGPGRMALIR